MNIVEIRGYQLAFEPPVPLGNASNIIRRREFLLLEIVTEDGTSGWGEVGASPWAAAALIRHGLGTQLLGKPVRDYGRIFHGLMGALGYDRRGPAMMAISAIDMALHDAAARIQGVSVATLLGGALRQRVLAYASGPFIAEGDDPYGAYPTEVETYLRRGFRAVKPRAGADPRADGVMVEALRRVMGPELGLMVDINRGYIARAAIEAARHMAPAGLLWIEEPVQPEDLPGYRAVAAAVPTAIAGGEALGSLTAFRDFLVAATLSVVQPDLSVCGGYSGLARVAALAAAFDVPAMPHVFGTVVNFHASLQMAALLPARRGGGPAPYPFVEYDVSPNPLLTVLGEIPLNPDGTVSVPEGPGAGFTLRGEQLAPWITETWRIAR